MNCSELVDRYKSFGNRRWLKQGIRNFEKIENRTPQEQLKLCILYSVMTSIPCSDDPNPIYDICSGCEHERLFCYGEM